MINLGDVILRALEPSDVRSTYIAIATIGRSSDTSADFCPAIPVQTWKTGSSATAIDPTKFSGPLPMP